MRHKRSPQGLSLHMMGAIRDRNLFDRMGTDHNPDDESMAAAGYNPLVGGFASIAEVEDGLIEAIDRGEEPEGIEGPAPSTVEDRYSLMAEEFGIDRDAEDRFLDAWHEWLDTMVWILDYRERQRQIAAVAARPPKDAALNKPAVKPSEFVAVALDAPGIVGLRRQLMITANVDPDGIRRRRQRMPQRSWKFVNQNVARQFLRRRRRGVVVIETIRRALASA